MILVRNGNESAYSTRRKTFLDFMGIIAQVLWEMGIISRILQECHPSSKKARRMFSKNSGKIFPATISMKSDNGSLPVVEENHCRSLKRIPLWFWPKSWPAIGIIKDKMFGVIKR